MSNPILLVGVLLALAGAGSVLLDAAHSGGSPRFIAYLVGLLLSLAGVGLVLTTTL
ncbi:hypothetical protein Halar_2659 [halophilic archaeon DL31]|jgi:hypothetical protein|nr:hypothetical protein Halar_2659 [halophilic archaeon DL31]